MMRNRFVVALMGAICCVGFLVGAATVEVRFIADFRTLKGGNVYVVKDNIEGTAQATQSGLRLASGTAYLFIPNGKSVKVKGGDASGWLVGAECQTPRASWGGLARSVRHLAPVAAWGMPMQVG